MKAIAEKEAKIDDSDSEDDDDADSDFSEDEHDTKQSKKTVKK